MTSAEEGNCHLLNTLAIVSIVNFLTAALATNAKVSKVLAGFRQILAYGRYGLKSSSWNVPKHWFRHFYIFASSVTLWSLYWVFQVAILQRELPKSIIVFLNALGGGRNRPVLIDTTATCVALSLLCLHCLRRCYETQFVQIFSTKGRMSPSLYAASLIYYFGVVMTFLINAEGFVEGSTPSSFTLTKLTLPQCLAMFAFLFSCWQQHMCNKALASLRKDPQTGTIVTERHVMPTGGLFEWVTSPHMLFEIVIYVSMLGFMAASKTWWLIVIVVTTNQIYYAVCAHQWSKENFKNYPKQRKALIPFLL